MATEASTFLSWFVVRNLNSTAAQVEKLLCGSPRLLKQIRSQCVNDMASIAFAFHEMGLLENLQMMRNRGDFDFEKFGNIANRHFSMAEQINDFQTKWIGECLQLIGT